MHPRLRGGRLWFEKECKCVEFVGIIANVQNRVLYHGFTRHMSVKEFPRLIAKVLRGTYRYQILKALRSASERTNSSTKDDLCILNKPKIRGLKNAGVLAQMAVSVLLLKRIARFIVKVTLALRKMLGDIKLS